MPRVENNVIMENVLRKWGPPFEREEKRVFGKTSAGQRYVITVSRAVIGWYKIGLYLEEEYIDVGKLTPYHNDRFFTKEKIEWLINRLDRDPVLTYKIVGKQLGQPLVHYFKIVKFLNDCKTNPEKYLKRGQHVRISRKAGLYTHDAIYVGEKKVIHVYGEDKALSQVQKDDWSTFIGEPMSWWGTVSVVVYRLQVRSLEEVAVCAESLLENKCWQCKNYNFITRNCQHFASYCATGSEISYGAHSAGQAALRAVISIPTGGVVFAQTPSFPDIYSPLHAEP